MEAVGPEHLALLPPQLTVPYGSIVFEGKTTHTPQHPPSPHAWGRATPHWGRWQHSPGGTESPGRGPRPGSQHSSGSNFLAINLSCGEK